jgi:hypothetical protein
MNYLTLLLQSGSSLLVQIACSLNRVLADESNVEIKMAFINIWYPDEIMLYSWHQNLTHHSLELPVLNIRLAVFTGFLFVVFLDPPRIPSLNEGARRGSRETPGNVWLIIEALYYRHRKYQIPQAIHQYQNADTRKYIHIATQLVRLFFQMP